MSCTALVVPQFGTAVACLSDSEVVGIALVFNEFGVREVVYEKPIRSNIRSLGVGVL